VSGRKPARPVVVANPCPQAAFPRPMTHRRAQRWLDKHNPYRSQSIAGRQYAAAFWAAQAATHRRRSVFCSIVAAAFYLALVLAWLLGALAGPMTRPPAPQPTPVLRVVPAGT